MSARGKLNRGAQSASQVRVGILIVVSLLVLVYGIYQVGRLFDVFATRYPLVTFIENSGGMMPGAPVTLAGQRVGQVDEIRFIPVEERVGQANIRVRLSVNRNVQEQIRADSRASLRTQGLLGDRYIDIAPGSPATPMLVAGDVLPTEPALDYEQVLETAARTLEDVEMIVADLQVTSARLAAGEGDRLYERMTAATTELAGLLATVNRADGTMARLIRDPSMYDQMERALARLDTLGLAVLAGEGTLGRLIHDDALYEGLMGTVGRVDTALVGMEGWIQRMVEADGTIARLIEDPELYDQFLRVVVDIQNLIRDIRDEPRAYRPEVRVRVF
jgi:phospholipid/cholesterol/gamma-HCH transport system substrate-binding protein